MQNAVCANWAFSRKRIADVAIFPLPFLPSPSVSAYRENAHFYGFLFASLKGIWEKAAVAIFTRLCCLRFQFVSYFQKHRFLGEFEFATPSRVTKTRPGRPIFQAPPFVFVFAFPSYMRKRRFRIVLIPTLSPVAGKHIFGSLSFRLYWSPLPPRVVLETLSL